MKATLPGLSSTRERIKNRIQNTRTPSDRKLSSKSPADEFEESTADLTSAATSYQFSLSQTPQSTSRPKVQRPAERPEPDCYQSVVSDVTWQEHEFASSAGRRSSFSSNPLASPQPSAPASTPLYHHGYSAEQSPRAGYASNKPSQNYGNHLTDLSKPPSSRPQYKQSKPHNRRSMDSVVSELTWNEPIPQGPNLLEEPSSPVERKDTTSQFLSLSSPPPKTTAVLGKLGRKKDVSEAEYFASRGPDGYSPTRQKESSQLQQQRQPFSGDDSISSIVSDVTWIDLDSSTIGGRPSISATDASPPDSRSRSPVRSTSEGRQSRSFHDSGGVSEVTFMNSESSLKISDLMRSSIMEAANESSGSPSNSGGSKDLLGASSSSKDSPNREISEAGLKKALEKTISDENSSQNHHSLRRAMDAMPRVPTRKLSSSSDEALLFSDSDLDTMSEHSSVFAPNTTSLSTGNSDNSALIHQNSEHSVGSSVQMREKTKAKKKRESKKREDLEMKLSEHSTNSAFELGEKPRSKKRGTKAKAAGKSKSTRKTKKNKKKTKEDSGHSRVSELGNVATKSKKKAKKKKSKDSDRSKLDDSEHDFEGKLKKAPTKKKKKKKAKLDDSERTTGSEGTVSKTAIAMKRPEESELTERNHDSEGTLKTKITKKPEESERTERTHDSEGTLKTKITKKKLDDSDRSVFGTSDRTNFSSTSTFDLDELPELKEIGVPKTRRRGELDGSNHSTQSAFEIGYSGQQMGSGRRSSRGRNGDLDSSSHSVQSCLEMQATRLSIPKPSALAGEPARPAIRPKESTTPQSTRKSVTFRDGEPSRPLVPFSKKEVSRDWGESSLDRLPTMSLPSRGSPPSLPSKRVSQARRDSFELVAPARPKAAVFNPTGPSEGVNFLLDRLSAIVPNTESEPSNDDAPLVQRPLLSQDSFHDDCSTNALADVVPPAPPVLGTPKLGARGKLGLKPAGVSPPKLDAREKLGLKPVGVPPSSMLVTPTGKRIVGKGVMDKRRKASSTRKGEVFEAMHKMMVDEPPVDE